MKVINREIPPQELESIEKRIKDLKPLEYKLYGAIVLMLGSSYFAFNSESNGDLKDYFWAAASTTGALLTGKFAHEFTNTLKKIEQETDKIFSSRT